MRLLERLRTLSDFMFSKPSTTAMMLCERLRYLTFVRRDKAVMLP